MSDDQAIYVWRAISGWGAAFGADALSARVNMMNRRYVARQCSSKEEVVLIVVSRYPDARVILD